MNETNCGNVAAYSETPAFLDVQLLSMSTRGQRFSLWHILNLDSLVEPMALSHRAALSKNMVM